MFDRIHLIVLDSVGIGAAPDAAAFGDKGSDTLGHIAENTALQLPHLTAMGLGLTRPLQGIPAVPTPTGYAGRLREHSAGKDTMTGHWELMGLLTNDPFPTYPKGFSKELLEKLESFSGRKVVCNLPYSGTKVIDDYGPGQLEKGTLIVYTSADPVLQIAAHEEVIPLEELYRICHYAREITVEDPRVGRIIARPYTGTPGAFTRTPNRHDYALPPHGKTALDQLKTAGLDTIGIGKIGDIFSGQGLTRSLPTKSNADGMAQLTALAAEPFRGLAFLNLVDFDALYGHRRDIPGYAGALEEFDAQLPALLANLTEKDLVLITADHGNDPAFKGTDHTREWVPLIAYSKAFTAGGKLPDGSFADVAATLCANFGLPGTGVGQSLLPKLL